MDNAGSIVISDTFLNSVLTLDKNSQKKIQVGIRKFSEEMKGNGFQVHTLDRVKCDKTFRTARIDRDLRLVFSQQGERQVLLYVDHHDKAYLWAEGKYLKKSSFGSLYIHDQNIDFLEKPQIELYDSYREESLLERQGISTKDLMKLGMDEELAGRIHKASNDDDFMNLISSQLPEIQEALFDLASGVKNLTQVYTELVDSNVSEEDEFSRALQHKDSKRRFYLLEDLEELGEILSNGFEAWKIFLHPRQEHLVKQNYNGPALVEGGPGTGKTIVGIHRAVYLAKNVFTKPNQTLLICTYSRKLANYLQKKVDMLMQQKHVSAGKIKVSGIDSFIFTLAKSYQLHEYDVNPIRVKEILKATYEELKPNRPYSFFSFEYEHVLQSKGVKNKDDYLRVDRTGLGTALHPAERVRIWSFFENFLQKKELEKVIDFEDQVYLVYQAIVEGKIPPVFSAIIIDEAQDLTPLRLQLISKLCIEKKNGLFILSDQNQRIFRLNSWRKDTKIDIVGRTYWLYLNYRTTKQIREFADQQFIESSMHIDYLREYKSLLSGPDPIVKEFSSTRMQYIHLVRLIRRYINKGFSLHDIAIITNTDRDRIMAVLDYEGISYTLLEKDVYPDEKCGICISTLYGCKGLEFRVVILVNTQDIVLNDEEIEIVWYAEKRKHQIECLRYVAITRAREEVHMLIVEQE